MSTIIPAENADKAMRSGRGDALSERSSEGSPLSSPEPLNPNRLAQQPMERSPSLLALENAGRTPLGPWNGPSQMFSCGLSIRLVLYGRISAGDVHSIWIDHQSTYGDIIKELATIDATCTFTVLEPIWGPTPRWAEANPKSLIGNNSHVLYAVAKGDRRYIVGVVRASFSDYPVAIFESPTDPSMTVTQAIIASRPELEGRIKSITGLLEGQSGKDTDLLMDQDFKSTVIINASDDPPKTFMAELPTGSIPPLLRVPFAYCESLMKQAYDLEFFALQIIHILRAILHIIISLAEKIEATFKNDFSGVEIALNAQGEVSEWLRATPMLARNLQEILDRVEELMGTVTTAYPGTMQKEIEKVFEAVCGDYPGAVDVRHSHRLFTKLSLIDHEEDSVSIRDSGANAAKVTQNRGVLPSLNSYQPLQQSPLNVPLSVSARLAEHRTKPADLYALPLHGSTSTPSVPTGAHIPLWWGDPPPYSLLPPIPASAGGTNDDVDSKGKKATDQRSGPTFISENSAYQTPSERLTGYSSMSTIPRLPLSMRGPYVSPHTMQININPGEEAGVGIKQYRCIHCGLKFDRLARFKSHLDTHREVRPHLPSPIPTSLSSDMDFTSTEAHELHPKTGALNHKRDVQGENRPIDVPSKTSDETAIIWREALKTLADRSGLNLKSEEHQDQQGTWWSSYHLTNPDGSKSHYLGSDSGKSKAIAKEHAAEQSYGTLTTLINTWVPNATAASTSATGSAYTDPGSFWLRELERLSKEKGLKFVCDELQDSQGTWWATYHLVDPDGLKYFQLGSRGSAASKMAIEQAAHDAVETLNRVFAT